MEGCSSTMWRRSTEPLPERSLPFTTARSGAQSETILKALAPLAVVLTSYPAPSSASRYLS